MKPLLWVVAFGVCLAVAVIARAEEARVRVATLDGALVYHWRVFKSIYRDDIDRALILREFQREGFTVPERFVDGKLREQIAGRYGGDKEKLLQAVKRQGATLSDYRQFIAEEMILNNFPRAREKAHKKMGDRETQAQWLASLRKRARVEYVQVNFHD